MKMLDTQETPGYVADFAFGDSITAGSGASSFTSSWAPLLSNSLGIQLTDAAIPGAQACDVAYQVFGSANPGALDNNLQMLLVGTNDANINGLGEHEVDFKLCHQAEIAWLASSSSNKFTGASFATPPNGWDYDLNFATPKAATPLVGLISNIQGSTSTWPVTTVGGPIAIWYRIYENFGSLGTFTYCVDSGAPTAVSSKAPYNFSTNTAVQHYDSVGVIFIPTVAGTHNVKVSVTSQTSSSAIVGILAVGTSPTLRTVQSPAVYVGGVPYQMNDANSAETDGYNSDAQYDVNLLNKMGFSATFVDVRKYLLGTPEEMSDQLHPNDLGHQHLKEAFQTLITANAEPIVK